MKKRSLNLDFTSLLDVIMILLFIVVSSMGQATLDKQKDYEQYKEELQAEDAIIKMQAEEIADRNGVLEAENSELLLENGELTTENSKLIAENEYLRALNGESVDNKESLLQSLFEDSVRIILDCSSANDSSSSIEKVNINLFYGTGTSDKELSTNIISIQHDRTLSREERQQKNAEMQNSLANEIRSILERNGKEIAIITIRLKKGDPGITLSDVEIIDGAIRELSEEQIRCISDRMYY